MTQENRTVRKSRSICVLLVVLLCSGAFLEWIISERARLATLDLTILLNTESNVSVEDVRILIQEGANLNTIAVQGWPWTPLMIAARTILEPDVLRVLIENGANVNAANAEGMTPLMFAARYTSNPDVLRVLIENGANLNVIDNAGRTPLFHAVESNLNPEIQQLLRSEQIDILPSLGNAWTQEHAQALSIPQTPSVPRSPSVQASRNPNSASIELGTIFPNDIEIGRASPGDVTFILQVTDLTLGLDMPPSERLRSLDVSLYAPGGELFERQRIYGTRVSFPVPHNYYMGTWKMRINEARGFTPRQVVVAMSIDGLHNLHSGDPGFNPRAHMAFFNLIEGTGDTGYLIGASNPASVDVFIGGGGNVTYLGGAFENIYTWGMDGGHITIVNNAIKTEPSGILWVGEGPALEALVMERSGNNMLITLRDESSQALGSVTVNGWFSNPGNKLAMIYFEGYIAMSTEMIENWIETGGWLFKDETGEIISAP